MLRISNKNASLYPPLEGDKGGGLTEGDNPLSPAGWGGVDHCHENLYF